MRIFYLLCAFVFVISSVGCVSTEYEIEMSADGDKLKRKITVKGTTASEDEKFSAPEDEVRLLAAAYGREFPKDGLNPTTFENEFTRETPKGVGGAGYFLNWESNFGSTTLYLERFRGSDDFYTQLESRKKSVDEFVDQLIAWIEKEATDFVRVQQLKNVVDTTLRKDLQNVGIYFWHMQTAPSVATNGDSLARLALYLMERGWVTPEQLPEIVSPVGDSEEFGEEVYGWVIDYLCRKSEIDRKLLEIQVPVLANGKESMNSFRKFLEATGGKWIELPDLFGDANVDIGFHSPVEPLTTNGKWDAATKKIRWEFSVFSRDKTVSPANICFAFWCKPDKAAQIRRFGKVIFEEYDLVRYCSWYEQLGEADQAKWREILLMMKPDNQFNQHILEAENAVAALSEPGSLAKGLELVRVGLQKLE